jgi:hypothetical protein
MVGLLCGPAGLGRLSPWLRGGKVDPAVFRVAARFPIQTMHFGQIREDFPFDVDEFVREVEAEARK